MIRKDAWYDFNFLKFAKAYLVAQHLVNPGECSICTWEKCIICCCWIGCSINRLILFGPHKCLKCYTFGCMTAIKMALFCSYFSVIHLRDSLSSPNTQCCFLQYCFGKYFSLSLFDWVAHGTFRCSILRPRYNPKVGLHVWQFDSSTNLWRFSSGPEIRLCRVYWQFQFHTVEF